MSRRNASKIRRYKRIEKEGLSKTRAALGLNEHGSAYDYIKLADGSVMKSRVAKTRCVTAFEDLSPDPKGINPTRLKAKAPIRAPLRYDDSNIGVVRKRVKKWDGIDYNHAAWLARNGKLKAE